MIKILIVSGVQDAHAHVVMDALAARGDATVELLDLSEFPSRLSLAMAFDGGHHRFSLKRQGKKGAGGRGRKLTLWALKLARSGGVARSRDLAANHKPWQLTFAQEVGLEIPTTLMTSVPEAAQEFWHRPEETSLAESVRLTPVIFQKYVGAVADIRVIAIGQELFAAAADIRQVDYPVDVRMNLKVR